MKYKAAGIVLEMKDTVTFAGGFCKRDVILDVTEDGDKFPKKLCVTFKKDMCETVAEKCRKGDKVEVEFFIDAREWQDRFFTDITGVFVRVLEPASGGAGADGFPTTAEEWQSLVDAHKAFPRLCELAVANGFTEEDATNTCKNYVATHNIKNRAETHGKMNGRDFAEVAAGFVRKETASDASDPDDIPF